MAPLRLIVARCEVTYTGRLTAYLPESTRLLMVKADGSVLVHSDTGGFKPLNWMTPPTVFEDGGDVLVVRKRAGRSEDRLEIRLHEVLSDVEHEMGEAAGLEKDGVERDLQEALAAQPGVLSEGLRLERREWPTDLGPVDLMCRDEDGAWIAVEIKRVATIDAVEQLSRYLERIRLDPARAACRGILAAQQFKPQAVVLAESRGIACVEVDLALLRGEREPELDALFTSSPSAPSPSAGGAQIATPKKTSAPTRARSGHPCPPKAALRTSSTQWWSGFRSPRICAQRGRFDSGKNVPATRKSGVSTALVT